MAKNEVDAGTATKLRRVDKATQRRDHSIEMAHDPASPFAAKPTLREQIICDTQLAYLEDLEAILNPDGHSRKRLH